MNSEEKSDKKLEIYVKDVIKSGAYRDFSVDLTSHDLNSKLNYHLMNENSNLEYSNRMQMERYAIELMDEFMKYCKKNRLETSSRENFASWLSEKSSLVSKKNFRRLFECYAIFIR